MWKKYPNVSDSNNTFSMIPSGQASASNLTSLLMCGATTTACAIAVRPDDKDGPALALHALLDEHTDHDKVSF